MIPFLKILINRYPKQQRLLNLKKASVNEHSLPPFYLLHSEIPSLQPSKFDVILLDPPFSSSFTWDHLQELAIPALAADPSFVFLWVGSGAGEGLERGREVLAKWGYRRCEDVVWVKTNLTSNQGPGVSLYCAQKKSQNRIDFGPIDGSANYVVTYPHKATLSHWHSRDSSSLN